MRTAPRSGAKATATTRSPSAPSAFARSVCRCVSEYAFVHARKIGAKVFGGPKYTVSPVYEGMLKEEMDAAAARYPDIAYEPQLIDATYALLISTLPAIHW